MWVSLHLLELSQYLNLAWAALEATLPVAAQPPAPSQEGPTYTGGGRQQGALPYRGSVLPS